MTNAEPTKTGFICSDAECVGQFELQVVIKKEKTKKVKNRDFSHERIPEQEPTEAI